MIVILVAGVTATSRAEPSAPFPTPEAPAKACVALADADFSRVPDAPAQIINVYPYPIQARYKGVGDVNDEASFGPYDPTATK